MGNEMHKSVLAWVVGIGFMAASVGALFGAAGRLDWVEGWVYLGVLTLASLVAQRYVKRRNPGLAKHRRRVGEGTKSWDRVWLGLFRLLLLGMLVMAGLDAARFGWTSMPVWSVPIGGAILLVGYAISARAMAENPHFEGTVRIQHDRDHRVIESGPYAVVRHPGYVGIMLLTVGSPLMLRSWWALAIAGAAVLCVVLRTWLEDRVLQAELEGYGTYAQRVRARLLPGIW
jgi:protein-S-isoprenylcysteine O-methyltransferase Ste14